MTYNQQPAQGAPVNNGPIKAKLLNVRLHYIAVVDKVANRGDAAKPTRYEATILIPKSNQEALNAVLAAYMQIAQQNNMPINQQNPMQGLGLQRFPIKDGDNVVNADTGAVSQPHPGYWFVRTSTQFRPTLMTITGVTLADDKTQVIQNANEINQWFYNGVEAHAILTPFYYNNQGIGVGFNPAGLVSKGTGERLAAAAQVDVLAEFEGLFQDASTFDFGQLEPVDQTAQQPQAQQPAPYTYDPNAYAQQPQAQQPAPYTYDPNAYAQQPQAQQQQAPAFDPNAYAQQPQAQQPAPYTYDPNAYAPAQQPAPVQQQQAPAQTGQPAPGTWTPGGGNYGTNQ